jgi:rod shape-determining protein MreC
LANSRENIKIYLMRPNSKLKLGAVLILLIALFVVLNLTKTDTGIKNFFYTIFLPAQKVLWRAGANVSDFLGILFKSTDLKTENENLKFQVQDLAAQVASLSELKKENETLRNALNLGLRKDFRLVLVQVVSKNIDKDVILINKGAKDGLAPNMPLVTEQKVLVGKIIEVADKFSKVMLFTDKASSLDAKIIDSEIQGVIKGAGGFEAVMDLIPREATIKENDQVVTSALGGIFPPGILIGKIIEVEKNDTGSFQQAKIKPIFDSKILDNLFVIIDYNF